MRTLGLLILAVPLAAQGWKTVAARDAGLDPARLESWRAALAGKSTTGLLVARHGAIAFEWYADGWNADKPHGTASMAKALVGGVSLLVAMSDGRISPDDLASKYIPAWKADPRKSRITIRQLATHTSGIEDAEQDNIAHEKLPGWKGAFWRRDPDPFSVAVHDAPAIFEPGSGNAYSNPGMAALSYAITASLGGGDVRSLLKARVCDPLGIPAAAWSIGYGRAYDVDGLSLWANWGGASFTARATARVAQWLMLAGEWQGRQLVRKQAARLSTTDAKMPRPSRDPDAFAPASGLAFYVNADGVWPDVPRDAFAGAGAGHQVFVAIPSLDLVVVRNGAALAPRDGPYWTPIYREVLQPLMAAVTQRGPYPPSPAIARASFAPEIRREAIDSDNWPMTWGDDDAQYTSYGDGYGFEPRVERKLGMGFARVLGPAAAFRGENVRSDGERTGDGARSPKASGILMVDGVLYLWVRNAGNAALWRSKDHGRTWEQGFRLETGFGSPAFLNFGRNYAGARDGYVYTYSQDGPSAYESDNGLVLARAPKARLMERAAWEFLERVDDAGRPVWSGDIERRGRVFEYPQHVQRSDAVYDPGLKRYLLALGYDHAGEWGLFDAPEPWGPWTQVPTSWDVPGTHGYRLPAKWISADGLGMTLVFSGVKPNDAFCAREMRLEPAGVAAGRPPESFEVASVKRGDPLSSSTSYTTLPGGGVRVENASLKSLVKTAYDLRDFQLSGITGWMASERYTILAKGVLSEEPADYDHMNDAQRKAVTELIHRRLQRLLAERFQLAVHRESKDLPLYVLVIAKGGVRMRPNTSPDGSFQTMTTSNTIIKAQRASMDAVVQSLATITGRPVRDETGLRGFYDIDVKWAPETAPGGAPADGPTLFTALQEQLGLKLEGRKGPVEILVIDRAERPSEN